LKKFRRDLIVGGVSGVPIMFEGWAILEDRFLVLEVGRGISHDRLLTITQAVDKILVDKNM